MKLEGNVLEEPIIENFSLSVQRNHDDKVITNTSNSLRRHSVEPEDI